MVSVGVVTPVFNDEYHHARLLPAVAAQARPAEQIIVVDNGCSDRSALLASDPGVSVVTEQRQGIGAAAATGYSHACCEIIVRCDADSLPVIRWLERITNRFERDPMLDALTGPGYFTDLPWWFRAVSSTFYTLAYFGGCAAALARVPLWGTDMAFRR